MSRGLEEQCRRRGTGSTPRDPWVSSEHCDGEFRMSCHLFVLVYSRSLRLPAPFYFLPHTFVPLRESADYQFWQCGGNDRIRLSFRPNSAQIISILEYCRVFHLTETLWSHFGPGSIHILEQENLAPELHGWRQQLLRHSYC